MKEYELTVLIHPDLETDTSVAHKKIEKIISDNGGKIVSEEDDEKRRLAYEIRKCNFAIYHYYELELPAEAPAKISAVLNISDEVLRYLLVSKDPRKAKAVAKKAERAEYLKNNAKSEEKE